ncbi:aldose 1-epimerase family protein [uncultured Winogradskyella sp.]|uniref:aldose 1-epimerase family protein n=1 Tax=uncultured Winogradskyella sp. TaxID=395353 RepID=UPI00262C5152|nr:aldose 1-epimerase family protein [uncultured Winogradskyella sp.]
MLILKNHLLQIDIKPIGAELKAITSVKNNNEFMWHADPNVWGSSAPNLFPVIGSMKNDSYIYDNKIYKMSKHGFVRHSDQFKVKNHSNSKIALILTSNDQLYETYPFLFQYEISYQLDNNVLTVSHSVKNIDSKTLFFSLGGHPAFACPLYKDESYTDYYLEFEKSENSKSYLLNMENGLVTNKTKSVIVESNKIELHGDLFNEDALIFKDLKSRKVTLKHKIKGDVLSMKYKGFPYLGIWAKPNAPYVCIEPWLGIADVETTNQKIEDKEGIISLESGSVFNASYSIEIDNRHLG